MENPEMAYLTTNHAKIREMKFLVGRLSHANYSNLLSVFSAFSVVLSHSCDPSDL
jgi:hypothetical protein